MAAAWSVSQLLSPRTAATRQRGKLCCAAGAVARTPWGWQQARRPDLAAAAAAAATAEHDSSTRVRDQQHAAPAAAAPQGELRFPDSFYDEEGRLVLKNLRLPELEAWCESIGEDGPRRALQLWRFMYADRQWVRSLEEAGVERVQNGFSRAFRDKVAALATLDAGLRLHSIHSAADGTRKMVFRLAHGPAAGGQVETVLIPVIRQAGAKARTTLCVSSQVGCAMNCQFCFTGRMGLQGSLTPGQIVEQAVAARRLLYEEDVAAGVALHATPITNLVYMGMGEPLHNLPAVLASIDTLCRPLGMHFSHNKITVSTVGLIPEMRRFSRESRAVMAVSLHATTDEVRDWIVPVNRREGLQALIECMEELFPKSSAAPRHGHHVLIEYIMLRGVNDSDDDARRLVQLTQSIRCKINLIVFNPHAGTSFQPSTPERVYAFRSILIQGGHVATVRDSRGDDQMAACGQLGSPELGSSRPPPLLAPPERLLGAVAAADLAA